MQNCIKATYFIIYPRFKNLFLTVIIPDILGSARTGFSFSSLFMSRDDKGINMMVNQPLAA